MVLGFGFVLETNDFKVVQILYDCGSDDIPDVLVYSTELNSWRKIEATAPCYMPNRWSSNVYVNGAVHWMAYKRPKVGHLCDSIMSFHMSGEVFKEMTLPNNRPNGYDQLDLSVSASGEQISLPLNLIDNQDVLMVTGSGNLVSFDAENQQMKDLGISGLPSSFRIVTCTSSLMLLDRGEKITTSIVTGTPNTHLWSSAGNINLLTFRVRKSKLSVRRQSFQSRVIFLFIS
ncbi:hypothetical protein Vadar_016254 [Vaccinium darrowii]|uniref:Uncharacterized protein n=1 Tax=Vaccinium darrowii TaxID=229202 RepID=A0ACB7ZCM2_9ERIC|nr:hypothetical protein Vadar_016254 [Vaccinium darrowii]